MLVAVRLAPLSPLLLLLFSLLALTARAHGAAAKFTYVEGWQVIEIANHIFGFNGWSSTVIDISPDYVRVLALSLSPFPARTVSRRPQLSEENGKFEVGVTAVVKVTLKDGTCHEDVGYGMAEGPKKGPAIEKAKKQAVTDARKRALRLFGAALGNCLYSKQHVKKIRSARPDEEGFLEADIGEVKAKTVVRAAPYPGASSINGGGGGGGGGPCAATSTSSSSSSLSSNGVSPPRPLAPGIKEERPYMPAPTTTTSTTSPTSGMRPGAYQPQPQPQQARPQQPQQPQQHFQPMPPRPPMQQQPQPQPQYSSPNAPMFAAIPVQTTSHSQTLPPLEDYDAAIPDECGDGTRCTTLAAAGALCSRLLIVHRSSCVL